MGLLSRIRGRSKRSGTQAIAPEEQRIPAQQLLEAKANLARLKALPVSAFPAQIGVSGITNYSVDRKADAIARAKAEIAELRVLAKGNDMRHQPRNHPGGLRCARNCPR